MSLQDIYKPVYNSTVSAAASQYGVPADLLSSLIGHESGWNPYATSETGAIGLTQLLPSTAGDLQIDPTDPQQNIMGGANYLSQQYKTFGNWTDALRAYNVGPTAAANDPNAGLSYAQNVLSGAPSVSDKTANGSGFGIPSWAGTGLATNLNQLTGTKATNGVASFSDSFQQIATQLLPFGVALLAIALLIWYGAKALLPENTLVLSSKGTAP